MKAGIKRHLQNPCSRVTKTNGQIAESRNSQQADQYPGNHFRDTGKHGKIGISHPLDSVSQDAEQSQNREKETEMCRNNSVFFKISNSEASTKSRAKVLAPNISTQKVNAQ